MSEGRGHLLLVNPSAGGGRVGELLPRAEAALRANGLAYRLVRTAGLEHGVTEAEAAAEAGETVVVMSGDGLIGQVGGALAETRATMGIMPGGRGNDLARVLGIPTEPEPAAELIASATTRKIDVGVVNGRRFLCIASCGFDSDANRIANETTFVRGNLVYLYAAIRALAAWKPARFTLTLDGEERVITGYSVGAANSKAYGGGMYAAPEASLDDGLLDVPWCEEMGKLRFFTQVLPRLFKGTQSELPEIGMQRAREVRIEADRPFAVYADGDHITDLPATVSLLPGALELIWPPPPPPRPPRAPGRGREGPGRRRCSGRGRGGLGSRRGRVRPGLGRRLLRPGLLRRRRRHRGLRRPGLLRRRVLRRGVGLLRRPELLRGLLHPWLGRRGLLHPGLLRPGRLPRTRVPAVGGRAGTGELAVAPLGEDRVQMRVRVDAGRRAGAEHAAHLVREPRRELPGDGRVELAEAAEQLPDLQRQRVWQHAHLQPGGPAGQLRRHRQGRRLGRGDPLPHDDGAREEVPDALALGRAQRHDHAHHAEGDRVEVHD